MASIPPPPSPPPPFQQRPQSPPAAAAAADPVVVVATPPPELPAVTDTDTDTDTDDIMEQRGDVTSRRPVVPLPLPLGGLPSRPAGPLLARGHHYSTAVSAARPACSARHIARRTLGISLLLVTVFLWTSSNFLTSYILSDQTYNKPFFIVYVNTSFFAVSTIPLSIKYVLQNGGFRQAKLRAVQAWRERFYGPNKRRRRSIFKSRSLDMASADAMLEQRLLVSHDEYDDNLEAQPESPKKMKQQQLPFLETAKFSLRFAVIWFLGNYFSSACLEYTSVGSVTILTSTSSAWTLIFCALMGIESFSGRKLTGVMASLSGVILISLVDFARSDVDNGGGVRSSSNQGGVPHRTHSQIAIGDAMAFFSAVFYGIYVVMMKLRVGNEDRLNMPLFFGLVGVSNAILLWPLFPLLHYTGIEPFELPPSSKIWTVLLLNSMSCFISDVCWSYAMLLTTPLISTVGLSLTIPLSLIGEMVHYGQYPSPVYWLGASIVVMSFLFINQASNESEGRLKSASPESE
ncbi:hypothetical protein GGR50DRAFT_262647 [Xylaria sp. CBS 124048]|nr:hypothetical protein GGR50DRAFT_262647 [Xylaria sp. CBS 124048]